MEKYVLNFEDVLAAKNRIEGYAHKTPVLTSNGINEIVGKKIFFKCENMQRVGAFKFRGAWNAISMIPFEELKKGVCTHSSGNHAQAIALVAKEKGIPAYIVMPENSPIVKLNAVKSYGAEVIMCTPTLEAREITAKSVIERTGAHFIHPYDNPNVIAGQGTCSLELIEEVGDLDAVISPIGGGGMMAGTCITISKLLPDCNLIGAEPSGADDAARSFESGTLIPQLNPNTICDGLLTSLGEMTWPILRDHLNAIYTVSDQEVCSAMKLIWERMKIIVEPSSATALAVVMGEKFKLNCPESVKSIGIILTGGNVDLNKLPF
jgi:threonine dehydratase